MQRFERKREEEEAAAVGDETGTGATAADTAVAGGRGEEYAVAATSAAAPLVMAASGVDCIVSESQSERGLSDCSVRAQCVVLHNEWR